MSRTLTLTGEINWPIEDGKQAAKIDLAISLAYTSALHIEKVFSSPVVDEDVDLPMTSAKFLFLRALGTEDVTVKLNGNSNAHTLKAGEGFLLIHNPDGDITALTVSNAAAPATIQGWAFA